MSSYDSGYPTKPIGGGNPCYCCASCEVSDPQINGQLENHTEWCEYRKKKEAEKTTSNLKDENDWLKYLLKQIIQSLPEKRDWLDPEIERAARAI